MLNFGFNPGPCRHLPINHEEDVMNVGEAASELRRMYQNALQGEQVVSIHLFGIKYAEEVERFTASEIVRQAGLQASYATEVNKGKNLAKYVELKR